MDNRFVVIVIVCAVSILLGMVIVGQQSNEPLLKEILSQQTRMDSKLATGTASGADAARIEALETRIANLETQIKALNTAVKQAAAPAKRRPQEDLNKVYTIDVAHSPVYGNPDAKVTVVEFVDFQCPFCSRFHVPLVQAVKEYPNDVKYMVKNFPLSFHPRAKPASKAAFAANEQGKYWEMVDLLLTDIRNLSDQRFVDAAKELGLDVDKFKADLEKNDSKYEEWVRADMQLGAKVGVRGTPTFYINGKKTLARDKESFKREFQKILDEAK